MAFAQLSEEDLRVLFDGADVDKSGKIDRKEMYNIIKMLAEKTLLDIDDDECKAATAAIISKSNAVGDADNLISWEEFLALLGLKPQ